MRVLNTGEVTFVAALVSALAQFTHETLFQCTRTRYLSCLLGHRIAGNSASQTCNIERQSGHTSSSDVNSALWQFNCHSRLGFWQEGSQQT
jgi:hypothetical protein